MLAFFTGVAAVPIGAAILVWRAAARFRQRGAFAAVAAGVGGLALALSLVFAVFVAMALIAAFTSGHPPME